MNRPPQVSSSKVVSHPSKVYNKDDFFDSISCDVLDRQKGIDTHLRGSQERSLNTETFGAVSLSHSLNRSSGSGAGGGGRGRGGGGRRMNSTGRGNPETFKENQNQYRKNTQQRGNRWGSKNNNTPQSHGTSGNPAPTTGG